MGKTKTAFVGTDQGDQKKSSLDAYKEKKEKQAKKAASAQNSGEPKKIHIAGLKGGQRIKIVEAELPVEAGVKEGLKPHVAKALPGRREPRPHSKKYQEARGKIDRNKSYSPKDAIALVKETSYSKFEGTVELHLVVKKAGLSVNVTLPHPAGKEKKVEVAGETTIKKLEAGKIDFDILVATPEIMPKLIPFAKILGPKGLMPNPKNGTLITDPKKVKDFSVASVVIKTEKETPLIHTVIGKVSQPEKELEENLEAIIKGVSEKQIVKAYMKATMGPSVKLAI